MRNSFAARGGLRPPRIIATILQRPGPRIPEQRLEKMESQGGSMAPGSGRGYKKLTEYDQPLCPPPVYSPAPASLPPPPPPQNTSFSNNSSNVVVVSQPSAPQTETVVVEERPNDNLMWVLCLMVVCFCTGNLTAFLCLIPALILSLSSGCASNSGDYEAAAGYAKASCTCSVFSVVIYILAFVAGAIVAALLFTVGLGFIGIEQVDV